METVIGVTYPIPKKFVERFFLEGKTVFIKPGRVFKELKPGMKFVFYQSREDTGCVGEAVIKNIIFEKNPLNFLKIYKEAVFLTEEEINDYISNQKIWTGRGANKKDGEKRKKQWIAIELIDLKKYTQTIKPARFVSVGGRYIKG